MAHKKGTLYVVPSPISEGSTHKMLHSQIKDVLSNVKHFAVEDLRHARRYLKKVNSEISIDELTFSTLSKNTSPEEIHAMGAWLKQGDDVVILSEAGCPGIADPGNLLVKYAHDNSIWVIPISGPSAIFMALMGSGLNGQRFSFHGYLPKERKERVRYLRHLEKDALIQDVTQIFMDTPFRNNHVLEDLMETCKPTTPLCIAVDLSGANEMISTRPISDWKKNHPDLHKKPVVFILGKSAI